MKHLDTVRIRLDRLRDRAKDRPADYLQEILDEGTIEGNYLRLPLTAYETLRAKYSPPSTINSRRHQPHQIAGLGDLVHALAHPFAKAADRVLGTQLQNCSACARRREALNRQFPARR